jgi:hypothetical protein
LRNVHNAQPWLRLRRSRILSIARNHRRAYAITRRESLDGSRTDRLRYDAGRHRIRSRGLQQHEQQWAQRSFHSYVFDYSETQISTNYNVQITVQNDTVASVIDLNTGKAPTTPRTWPTMDALFNEADFAVLQGGVSLEYNDQYGYLTLFSIQSNNPGGQFLVRVSNLQPLE